MNWHTVLTKDYSLPPFRHYRGDLLRGLLFVILPNVMFWLIAYLMGLARPIINMDYLIPIFIYILPLPYALGRVMGLLLLVLMILVDVLMFAIQLFPFLDLAAIRYLAPFIATAPIRIWVILFGVVVYLIGFPFLFHYVAKKVKAKFVLLWLCLIALVGWYHQFELYHETQGLRFARGNYYYAQSQIRLYQAEMGDAFSRLTKTEPVITPYAKESAIGHFQQPFSDKILMIIAESWGMAREPSVQAAILRNIYQQKDRLEFIEGGFFDFYGATVQAEMRELCHMQTENGYAFGKLPAQTFEHCFPNRLKKQGYETVGLHGSSSALYDRKAWYPMIGFQKSWFGEHFPHLKRCYAFNGVCDQEMLNVVADEFKQAGHRKKLVYWMTLTAHLPYAPSDVRTNRFDCNQLHVTAGDICNNMRLQAQLFDDLGEIIKRPEMKGVEVIVVGDHMPPIMGDVPLYKNLHWNDVSWIHFKVKP